MLRDGLAVLVGYVVMAVWVMVGMALAWVLLGPGFAFVGGTTEVTGRWLAVALGLSLAGAVLGGLVTSMMARQGSRRAVTVLAGVVLVLGLIMAIGETAGLGHGRGREPAVQVVGEADALAAASPGRQPLWYAFLLPAVGAAGVLAGGALRRGDGGGWGVS